MSRQIDRLITELVAEDILVIKKMKKVELFKLTETLLKENLRELHDDTIVELYEEKFETHLARY
jgi:septin family protein